MGVIHIYDYLLISARDCEKNKKAINAIKGVPDGNDTKCLYIKSRVALMKGGLAFLLEKGGGK